MNASSIQTVDWPELARKANYSTSALSSLRRISVRQLQREFLQEFKESPQKWINELRLRDAQAWLEKGHAVKTVAMLLGYKHSPSFWRAFKGFYGVSPSSVRFASEPAKI
jgi:AraC family transcriptional regulator, exoenzyme S synthesis regulatory protein ExsA